MNTENQNHTPDPWQIGHGGQSCNIYHGSQDSPVVVCESHEQAKRMAQQLNKLAELRSGENLNALLAENARLREALQFVESVLTQPVQTTPEASEVGVLKGRVAILRGDCASAVAQARVALKG